MARFSAAACVCLLATTITWIGCGGDVKAANNPSTPNPTSTGNNPTPPATTPTPTPSATNSFVYVANNGSTAQVGGSISGFRINPADGSLTPVGGSPFAAGSGPTAITSDPQGHYVFVAEDQSVPGARGSNCTDTRSVVLSEALNSSGALTQSDRKDLDGACARAVVVDPSGKNLYVAMSRLSASLGEIQGFSIGSNGTLTELPGSPYLVSGTATGLAVHPNGKYIYAASDSGLMIIDRDTATGTLVERGSFNTPKNRLAINPAGTFLVASETNSNEVSQFNVDPSTGNIEALDSRPPASSPFGVAADPLGKFFAVTEQTDPTTFAGGLSTFLLDTATHQLMKTDGSPFSAGHMPLDVAFDTSGTFVYTVNRQDATVSGFTVDRGSGKLSAVPGSPNHTGDFPDSLVVVKTQ